MRILLVEEDIYFAEMLVSAVSAQRYQVDWACDGEFAWDRVNVIDYDLILLEMLLPKLDGIDLCKRLRAHNYRMPILLLTVCDDLECIVNGLDAGADEYIVKPVKLLELMARIRAMLRRTSEFSIPSSTLDWGSLSTNPSTYEVMYGEQKLSLTPKEYNLLELLLRNGRRVLSPRIILDLLWSLDNPPNENTIKTHIKSIRQKLRVVGADTDLIETVRNVGYRLKEVS
jgi:DNA-binding response OmpR family regulator